MKPSRFTEEQLIGLLKEYRGRLINGNWCTSAASNRNVRSRFQSDVAFDRSGVEDGVDIGRGELGYA